MNTKLQFYALRVFFFCLVLCALLVLGMVWSGKPDSEIPQFIQQTTVTLFVIGLAAFLVWLISFLRELRERIEKK